MNKGRFKDFDWNMPGAHTTNDAESIYPNDTIKVSLLLDIRDQMKELLAIARRTPRKPQRKTK